MSKQNYSLFHSVMQQVASSRPGAWFYSRTLHYFDRLVYRATRGRTTLTNLIGGVRVVFVTTVGARSGVSRTVPLLFIRDPQGSDSFALIASNWGQKHSPAWYFNLKTNPRATCSFEGQTREYVAHEARGEEYDKFWHSATETYIGYPLYKQRADKREIPIMVMQPANAD